METVLLRNMCKEDCLDVAELDAVCMSDSWSEKMFSDIMNRPEYHLFVATEKNRIIGFAGLLASSDAADIVTIGVDPQYRKRGIGESLLQKLISTAAELNVGSILLEVRASNAAAIGLYEKNNFFRISVRKSYYKHPTEDAVIMQRSIE